MVAKQRAIDIIKDLEETLPRMEGWKNVNEWIRKELDSKLWALKAAIGTECPYGCGAKLSNDRTYGFATHPYEQCAKWRDNHSGPPRVLAQEE